MTAETIDAETAQIMAANLAALVGKNVIIMEMRQDGSVMVHEHTSSSVMPQSVHPNTREGAARALQLLNIGPVWPQTWPETAQIGGDPDHAR